MVACGEMTPSVPPDQTIGICLISSIGRVPFGLEHLAEGPVGDDPGVVVDAAVALGLADDGDDAVGLDQPLVDQVGQPGGVGDALEGDLVDLDGLGHDVLSVVRSLQVFSMTVPARRRAVTASLDRCSDVMTERVAALLDEPHGGLDLGAHAAARELSARRRGRASRRR